MWRCCRRLTPKSRIFRQRHSSAVLPGDEIVRVRRPTTTAWDRVNLSNLHPPIDTEAERLKRSPNTSSWKTAVTSDLIAAAKIHTDWLLYSIPNTLEHTTVCVCWCSWAAAAASLRLSAPTNQHSQQLQRIHTQTPHSSRLSSQYAVPSADLNGHYLSLSLRSNIHPDSQQSSPERVQLEQLRSAY